MKKMSVSEFRRLGYLQEVNRHFLHPLGLALEIVVNEDGTEEFGEVWDSRDDPEGFLYDPSMVDDEFKERAKRIHLELWGHHAKAETRLKKFGYVVQPAGHMLNDEEKMSS